MATIASLIVSVAADTAQLVKGTDDVNKSLDKIGAGAVKMAGALGIGFSVGSVLAFTKGVFDAASEIHDLSSQLGISTDAVQGFKYAAEQSGSSLDAVGSAIQKMNQHLAGGDKATVQALKDAGLNFSAIRNMKPEDAFLAIADAIQGIPDPMVQSDVALKLFGKSAGSLLPGIKEGFRGAADGAMKMSRDTIDSLERAQDAWGTLARNVTIVSGELIGTTINTTTTITSSWRSFATFASSAFSNGIGAALALTSAQTGAATASKQLADVNLPLEGAIRKTKEQQDAAAKAAADHAKALQDVSDKLTGAGLIKTAKDYVAVLTHGVDVHKLTAEAQADVNKVMKAALDVYEATGRVAPQAMNDLYVATMKLPPVVSGLGDDWKKLGEHIDISIPKMETFSLKVTSGMEGWGNFGFVISKPTVPAALRLVDDGIAKVSRSLIELGGVIGGPFGAIVQAAGDVSHALDIGAESTKRWGNSAGIAAPIFSSAASTTQKWGSVLQVAATVAAGAMDVWTSSANAGSTAAGALHGAMAGAKAGAAFGPWGVAIGAAAGALVGFIRNLNDGRQAVIKFAESFGGFDEMHAKLLTLGAAGEELWIKLTQGVGKNNPAEAKKVIEEINKAFAAQDDLMKRLPALIEKYGLSWEQAGLKAKQAHLDEIAQGLIRDFADLSRAGFDVEVITVAMSDAINDYLQNAIATGVEVPAAMRPLLQKMIDLGLLTDAAGVKIEDLKDIPFATTLTQGFKDIVDAIHELTRALGGAGQAIDDINARRIRIPVEGDPGPGPGDDGGREPALNASRWGRSGMSVVGGSGSSNRDADSAAADRHFMLVQIPKAITAALQKGAA